MQIQFFTAPEATKIIMDKLRQRGLTTFISESTVLEVVNAIYLEGESLVGDPARSPYLLGMGAEARINESLNKKFGG